MRTTALLSTAWAARRIRAGRAAQPGWGRRMCARWLLAHGNAACSAGSPPCLRYQEVTALLRQCVSFRSPVSWELTGEQVAV
jgi:hypothetical protein